ncbi:hypothetical protein SAMN05216378_0357 [Paenibacillus catalpae]|uniref:Uncharacterized protein n=1 Tax=Paenibacillus catalpae TaxID=1045775 RepID=A0A1I1T4Q5_9BACL|nr:hypothetical protein SAMN05216378_0357 [Paenibacillus catalpae]
MRTIQGDSLFFDSNLIIDKKLKESCKIAIGAVEAALYS